LLNTLFSAWQNKKDLTLELSSSILENLGESSISFVSEEDQCSSAFAENWFDEILTELNHSWDWRSFGPAKDGSTVVLTRVVEGWLIEVTEEADAVGFSSMFNCALTWGLEESELFVLFSNRLESIEELTREITEVDEVKLA
jgi:hypothetical protein